MAVPLPLVSVLMITYLHENFIEEAIEGVLMQECDFEIELIIANDCSPDNTHKIIQSILKSHPKANRIKYFRHEKNLGMMPNFLFGLNEAKSKYIALCEGDDYWIDPLKIQKQVDFLQNNERFVITYHDAIKIDNNGNLLQEKILTERNAKDYSAFELKRAPHILTLTILFRNVIKEYPSEINNVINGDTFLFSILGNYGEGKFMPEVGNAAYRKHINGVWSSVGRENRIKHQLKTYLNLIEFYNKADDKEIQYHFNIKASIRYKMLILFYLKKLRLIKSLSNGIKLMKIFITLRRLKKTETEMR